MGTYKLPANPAALFSMMVGSGGLHMMISSWSDCITTPGNCGNHTRTWTKPWWKKARENWVGFCLSSSYFLRIQDHRDLELGNEVSVPKNWKFSNNKLYVYPLFAPPNALTLVFKRSQSDAAGTLSTVVPTQTPKQTDTRVVLYSNCDVPV